MKYNTIQESLKEEQWKDLFDINQYPVKGIYEISNLGRVRRKYKTHYFYTNGSKNNCGYMQFSIFYQGKLFKQKCIHVLVCTAFLRQLQDDEVCHHKNENKIDNRLNNLVIMTKKEHVSYHHKDKIVSQKTKQKMHHPQKQRIYSHSQTPQSIAKMLKTRALNKLKKQNKENSL